MAEVKISMSKGVASRLDQLDIAERMYVGFDSLEESWATKFNFKEYNEMYDLLFEKGEIGMISDCFIIYAVASCGVAHWQDILRILKTYKMQYKDLSIPVYSEVDNSKRGALQKRLRKLVKAGLLMRCHYVLPYSIGKQLDQSEELFEEELIATELNKSNQGYHIILYTATNDAVSYMNAKICKEFKPDKFLAAIPKVALVGRALSSYVSSSLVYKLVKENRAQVEFLPGVFKSRGVGTTRLDNEIRIDYKNKVSDYVAVINTYSRKNTSYMINKDYDNIRLNKIYVLRDYLMGRTKKGIAKVICCVESKQELYDFIAKIVGSGLIQDYSLLERLYFTGEGLICDENKLIEDCFFTYSPEKGITKAENIF